MEQNTVYPVLNTYNSIAYLISSTAQSCLKVFTITTTMEYIHFIYGNNDGKRLRCGNYLKYESCYTIYLNYNYE